MRRASLIAAAVLAMTPQFVLAQSWKLSITPEFGWYRGTEPLGYGSPTGNLLRMAPSHVVGMQAELSRENAWWSMRLAYATTLDADLQRLDYAVPDNCDMPCIISLDEYASFGDTGEMMTLGLQVTISPGPQSWRVAPYVIAGAGLTRFDLGGGRYPTPDGYWYGGREASRALQAGIGVRARIGRGDLVLEAVNATSGMGKATAVTPNTVVGQIFGDARNDLTVMLGYRVRVF